MIRHSIFVNRYIIAAAWLLLGAVVWTFWPRVKPTVGESAPLPPAKEVRTVEKVRTEVKVVYVYPDENKGKLNLPADVVKDSHKKLTTTGHLDAQERPYTLSAVLDTETGQSEVYARPDPLTWIGPGKRGAAGIAYGLKNGQPIGQLYAYQDLLRIKSMHAGARGNVDTSGDWFAGAYVEYRW